MSKRKREIPNFVILHVYRDEESKHNKKKAKTKQQTIIINWNENIAQCLKNKIICCNFVESAEKKKL